MKLHVIVCKALQHKIHSYKMILPNMIIMEESRRLYFYMCYKPTMISPSCIFFSSFVSTCRFVCIVPSEVIAQLAVSRPKFLFKSHPGVPTCINKN